MNVTLSELSKEMQLDILSPAVAAIRKNVADMYNSASRLTKHLNEYQMMLIKKLWPGRAINNGIGSESNHPMLRAHCELAAIDAQRLVGTETPFVQCGPGDWFYQKWERTRLNPSTGADEPVQYLGHHCFNNNDLEHSVALTSATIRMHNTNKARIVNELASGQHNHIGCSRGFDNCHHQAPVGISIAQDISLEDIINAFKNHGLLQLHLWMIFPDEALELQEHTNYEEGYSYRVVDSEWPLTATKHKLIRLHMEGDVGNDWVFPYDNAVNIMLNRGTQHPDGTFNIAWEFCEHHGLMKRVLFTRTQHAFNSYAYVRKGLQAFVRVPDFMKIAANKWCGSHVNEPGFWLVIDRRKWFSLLTYAKSRGDETKDARAVYTYAKSLVKSTMIDSGIIDCIWAEMQFNPDLLQKVVLAAHIIATVEKTLETNIIGQAMTTLKEAMRDKGFLDWCSSMLDSLFVAPFHSVMTMGKHSKNARFEERESKYLIIRACTDYIEDLQRVETKMNEPTGGFYIPSQPYCASVTSTGSGSTPVMVKAEILTSDRLTPLQAEVDKDEMIRQWLYKATADSPCIRVGRTYDKETRSYIRYGVEQQYTIQDDGKLEKYDVKKYDTKTYSWPSDDSGSSCGSRRSARKIRGAMRCFGLVCHHAEENVDRWDNLTGSCVAVWCEKEFPIRDGRKKLNKWKQKQDVASAPAAVVAAMPETLPVAMVIEPCSLPGPTAERKEEPPDLAGLTILPQSNFCEETLGAKKNTKYWLTEADIQAILPLRMGQFNLGVRHAVLLRSDLEVLDKNVDGVYVVYENSHWFAAAVIDHVLHVADSVLPKKEGSFVDHTTQQQQDSYNCGVIAIENAVKMYRCYRNGIAYHPDFMSSQRCAGIRQLYASLIQRRGGGKSSRNSRVKSLTHKGMRYTSGNILTVGEPYKKDAYDMNAVNRGLREYLMATPNRNTLAAMRQACDALESTKPKPSLNELIVKSIVFLGVPGCGKSHMVQKAVWKQDPNATVVVPTTQLAEEYMKIKPPMARVYTMHSAALEIFLKPKRKMIVVDECFMFPLPYLCALASKCEHLWLLGDDKQIGYIDFQGAFKHCVASALLANYLMFFDKIENTTTRRCPLDICDILRRRWYKRIDTTSTVTDSIVKITGESVDLKSIDTPVMVFTQKEKSYVKAGVTDGIEVMTVHECQGRTFENVTLYMSADATGLLSDKLGNHVVVAITRHTDKLFITSEDGHLVTLLLDGNVHTMALNAGVDLVDVDIDDTPKVQAYAFADVVSAPSTVAGVDLNMVVNMMRRVCPTKAVPLDEVSYVNVLLDSPKNTPTYLKTEMLAGHRTDVTLDVDVYRMLVDEKWVNFLDARSLDVVLLTMTRRYMTMTANATGKMCKFYLDGLLQAMSKIIDWRKFKITPEMVSLHYMAALKKYDEKGGDVAKLGAMEEYADFQLTFNVKNQFKPNLKVEGISNDKAGQGVSAMGKRMNFLFLGYTRAMEAALKEALIPQVQFTTGLDESKTMLSIQQAYVEKAQQASKNRGGMMFFECDFTQFDSCQNNVEHALMGHMFSIAGVPDPIVRQYMHIRRTWQLATPGIVTIQGHNKKHSGEPATLLGNTIFNMAVVESLTKVEGRSYSGYKGDDSIIIADDIKIRQDWHDHLKKELKYITKLSITSSAKYVGYVVNGTGIALDFPRYVGKIISKFYRTEQDFEDYKIAVADWIKPVKNEQVKIHMCTVLAQHYKQDPHVFDVMYTFMSMFSTGAVRWQTLGLCKRREVAYVPLVKAFTELSDDVYASLFAKVHKYEAYRDFIKSQETTAIGKLWDRCKNYI
nr:MAG: nonstructural polyprotein [Wufeng shrew bastrovirus 1]